MDDFLSLYEEAENYDKTSSPLCDQLSRTIDVYTDEREIAKGGMKTIAQVFCNSTHRYIAKATLNEPEKIELRDAFIREARLTALLDHPNIIKIYQIALSQHDEPFFTMELKTGSSLQEYIRQSHSRGEVLGVFIKICDAISYAHSRRVLHLDLKPDNVQVGSFGEVVVCDWGLGKIITREDSGEETASFQVEADMLNHCTMYGEAKGTPAYMAPEQLKGKDKNEQTDIYSLGALLFTILVPHRLQGKNLEARLEESRSGVHDDLAESQLPSSISAVIAKAMDVKPSRRYQSVEELKSDVERYLNTYPTEAQGAGFFIQISHLWKRNKFVSTVLSGSLIIIISSLLFSMNEIKQSEKDTLKALEKSERYAADLEKSLNENKSLEETITHIPKTIVDRIFADNQKHRDYQLLMTPKVSLERSNQYLSAAYETKPNDIYIIRALAANYFFSMNFEAFASFYLKHENELNFYAPYFDEHLRDRDLAGIEKTYDEFEIMANFASRLPVLMELIVAYNAERFKHNAKFPSLLADLIFYYFPKNSKLVISLKNQKLELWGPKLQRMTSPVTQLSLLRYLDFKDLLITENSLSDAKEFAGLNLRSLQIQHTQIRDLKPLLELPSLDHVTIVEGQVPDEQLEEFSSHFSKDLVEVYAAINADYKDGAKIEYNHVNYTSKGFLVGFYMNTQSQVDFTLMSKKAAKETISLRYSAGYGDAVALFTCNGVEREVILKYTGEWKQWATIDLDVDMKQGKNILSFRMKYRSKDCFNLDYISRKITP